MGDIRDETFVRHDVKQKVLPNNSFSNAVKTNENFSVELNS